MAVEFRVRWRREDRQPSTVIYQTWHAAHGKAQRVMALEQVKDDTRFESMPALVEPPVIQVRDVSEWRDNQVQPPPPSERLCESMREWATPDPDPDPLAGYPF